MTPDSEVRMGLDLDSFLEFVPAGGRKLVKFGVFVAGIAVLSLASAHWVNAQASERIEHRVRPLEAQLIQLAAVAEATFNGQEDLRLRSDPHAVRRDIREIKRSALAAALKQAEEDRRLEDQTIRLSSPGGE